MFVVLLDRECLGSGVLASLDLVDGRRRTMMFQNGRELLREQARSPHLAVEVLYVLQNSAIPFAVP